MAVFNFDTFPPEMSFESYKLLSDLLLYSFILLSFRSPKSFLHSIILTIITICFIVQPIIYKGKYPANLQSRVASFGITIGFKMCIWIKKYIINKNNDFQPFLYTLFYWRKNVTSGKKDDFQPKTIEIIKKLLKISLFTFIKWKIYEFCFKLLDDYSSIDEIPSSPYFYRLIDMFISGTPPITFKLSLLYLFYMLLVYLVLSIYYDTFLLMSGVILLFLNIIFPLPSNNNNRKEENENENENEKEKEKEKEKESFFKGKIFSIERWCISFLFDTQGIFNSPWLSISPKEFWNYRWHTIYNESCKELGYSPLHDLIISSKNDNNDNNNDNNKLLARIVGTLGGFCVSGIIHEYLLLSETNTLTFEQFNFFLFHGIVLIIWDFISKRKNNNNSNSNSSSSSSSSNMINRIILFLIFFVSLPSMIEPYFRFEQWLLVPTRLTDLNRIR